MYGTLYSDWSDSQEQKWLVGLLVNSQLVLVTLFWVELQFGKEVCLTMTLANS